MKSYEPFFYGIFSYIKDSFFERSKTRNMKKKWLLSIFAAFMIFAGTNSDRTEAASVTDLTTTAYQYIGIPYVYGGTSTNGFDCSGFTQRVYKDLGYSLNRTSGSQYQQGSSVSKSNLQPGDLVFYNTSGAGVSHVGIYMGDGKFVHSATSSGVKVSRLSESYWANRYVGAKRVANIAAVEVEVKEAAIDYTVYASRGEVAIQLAKALNLDISDVRSPFVDVKSTSKYAGAVTALYKNGVLTGDESGKFNPGSPLTRAQLAKVLVVAFDLKLQGGAEVFKDVSKSHWAYDYVTILASNDITSGMGDGTFGVNEYVKLIQLDTFLTRTIQ